jgi:hypothetical protein
LSTPIAVKVAEIDPSFYLSQVKPASLEWECIPDPASLCKITFWNTPAFSSRTLLSRRQQETMKDGTTALL